MKYTDERLVFEVTPAEVKVDYGRTSAEGLFVVLVTPEGKRLSGFFMSEGSEEVYRTMKALLDKHRKNQKEKSHGRKSEDRDVKRAEAGGTGGFV